MRRVRVQGMYQRWPLDQDPDPRVAMAMAMDPPLVALGQPKPTLQIEVVLDLLELVLADEQAGEEAEHHRGHVVANRIVSLLEFLDQLLEPFLTVHAVSALGVEGRGHRRDDLDVLSNHLLLLLDFVEAALDASGQALELRFREPPFFETPRRSPPPIL